ncbi:hypothetical protein HYW67_01805 [Candidatus Parcubacteria bacterium]|nr:hypothetical protein [Candidatus Parcubacteria bacterium]
MRRALFVLIALLAILFVVAPPPAIANTKSGSEPILTVTSVTITSGDMPGTIQFAITQGEFERTLLATATWTAFQRGDGLTIAAIPTVATVPDTAAMSARAPDPATHRTLYEPWRLADCTGTAHGDIDTTTKPAPTALIANGGFLGQLRR